MKKRIVLLLSLTIAALLCLSIVVPFNKPHEAKSVNAMAFEQFSALSGEARMLSYLDESPKRQSEIFRGMLEAHSSQMKLDAAQAKWVNEALAFHDEKLFAHFRKNFPITNHEEFRKTDLIKSYEKLQSRGSQLFSEDQLKEFCISSVVDKDSRARAARSFMNRYSTSLRTEETVNCMCNPDSWCTDCASKHTCGLGGTCESTYVTCGCVGLNSCTRNCNWNPGELESQ